MMLRPILKTIERGKSIFKFLFKKSRGMGLIDKIKLVFIFYYISTQIECKHQNVEMLEIADAIMQIPKEIRGVIVEAGAYKGGSAAKLSLVAKLTGRKLVVFDSFCGIPPNKELHIHKKLKKAIYLPEGLFFGSLQEVKQNIQKYGNITVCEFKKGWFAKTMPQFKSPIVAAFLDVDLVSSTKTCLMYLYPLISKKGVLFSHDGNLKKTAALYNNERFWKNKVGCPTPHVVGFGEKRLLRINK